MLETIRQRIRDFVNERDWEQFHNPKDLAIALSVEAGELLENYLWKDSGEAEEEKVRQELADVLIYAIMLADKYGFALEGIIGEKMDINEAKYPADKARGRSTKYDRY